jgi:hypothetical protein
MSFMPDYPIFSYPPFAFLRLGANVFFGSQRSFRQDGYLCIKQLKPPLHVLGTENIPAHGPCLITFNHYYRRGFSAWWMALALGATVPVDIHFVMTGELTYPGKWYAPLGSAGSRWLLSRLGKIYGFSTMPPMPPQPMDVEARARAVRNMLKYAGKNHDAVIGLAPEGGDQPGGILTMPPSGAGRFIYLLAGPATRIVPVGVYEEGGAFYLSFGQAYNLPIQKNLSSSEKDRATAEIVMRKIAAQLPKRLRGSLA